MSVSPTGVSSHGSSSSSSSSSSSISSSSSSDTSLTHRLFTHRVTIRIPTSDPEEASTAPASSLQFPALQIVPTSPMMQEGTRSAIYTSQMEPGMAASPTIIWTSRSRGRGGPDGRREPTGSCRIARLRVLGAKKLVPTQTQPPPPELSHLGWTPPGAMPRWASVETSMQEEFEGAAQQNVQGTTEEAMDYVLDVLGQVQADMENWFAQQSDVDGCPVQRGFRMAQPSPTPSRADAPCVEPQHVSCKNVSRPWRRRGKS